MTAGRPNPQPDAMDQPATGGSGITLSYARRLYLLCYDKSIKLTRYTLCAYAIIAATFVMYMEYTHENFDATA